MTAKSNTQAAGGQTSRVDVDFWPAWMAENPSLFVQRVNDFLHTYSGDEWECCISRFAYRVRLTAVQKTAQPTPELVAQATSGLVQVVPGSFKPNPDMSTEVPGLTNAEAAQYLGQRKAFEAQLAFPVAQDVTEVMVDAALKAACFHSTTESRKDMRNALQAALKAAAPSPVALQGRDTSAPSMPTPALPFNTFTCRQVEKLHLDWANYTATIRASLPAGGVVPDDFHLISDEQVAALEFAVTAMEAIATKRRQTADVIEPVRTINDAAKIARAASARVSKVLACLDLNKPVTPQPSETQGRRQMTEDTARLDAMQRHRIALIPEFEGPWDAHLYGDDGEPESSASGDTPRSALDALLAYHGFPASPQDGGAA